MGRNIIKTQAKLEMKVASATMSAPDVILDNVSFTYPGAKESILENMSVHFASSSFNVVLGRSGGGKSTLLRLIAGLYQVNKGKILISGEEPLQPSLDRSLVFQQTQLFPWMKLKQNVSFVYKKAHPEVNSKSSNSKALQFLKMVDLEKSAEMYPYQLSGGMLQRAAFAVSMAQGATLWLLDEPFTALDPDARAKARDLILRIWDHGKAGRTLIFVTHDVEETLELAQKIFYLQDKKIHKEIYLHNLDDEKKLMMRETLIDLFRSDNEKL